MKKLRGCLITFLALLIPAAVFAILLQVGKWRWNDSCSTCHKMREYRATLENSVHHRIECGKCHRPVPPIRKMFAANIRGRKLYSKHRLDAGTTAQCKKCHIKEWNKEHVFRKSILFSHERHEKRAPGCTICHPVSSHPKELTRAKPVSVAVCRDCHSHRRPARTGPAEIKDLHQYEKQPHPAGWLLVHKNAAAAKNNNCSNCHKKTYCSNCHEKFVAHGPDWRARHGEEARKDLAPCQVCHLPEGCADCHTHHMPKTHNSAWTTEHSKDLNVKTCMPCHRLNFCNACHVRAKPSSHTDAMIRNHAGFSIGKEQVCAVCHKQNPCMECHKIAMPHPKDWVSRHPAQVKADQSSCSNCHKKTYCAACHEKKLPASHSNKAAWTKSHGKTATQKRSDCSACHANHFCVSCHNLPMPHPKNWENSHSRTAQSKPQACSFCHKQNDCRSCHEKTRTKPASHVDKSIDFMKRHGALSRKKGAACEMCHDKKTSCDNCHGVPVPHQPEFLRGHRATVKEKGEAACVKCHTKSFCKDCHTKRAKHAPGWLKAHGDRAADDAKSCLTCHQPDNCLKCHANAVSGAKLVHPDCTFCHDSKTFKVQSPQVCGDCHSDIHKQLSAIAVKQDCSLCHTPHRFKAKPDVCTGCHDMSKKELHSNTAHSECSACHKQHTWKPEKRDYCYECHVDKKQHYEDALCWDCHPFK